MHMYVSLIPKIIEVYWRLVGRERKSHLCLDSEFFFVLNMLGIVLFRKSSGNTEEVLDCFCAY